MESQDTSALLAQLRGIHLPPAPAAPDLWPLYLAVLLCVIATAVFFLKRNNNRFNWKKSALSELDNIKAQSSADAVQQIATLLKRIALTHDQSRTTRHLHGEPWLQYLDSFYQTEYFSRGDGRVFGSALYTSKNQLNNQPDDALFKKLRRLIKHCERRR